MSTRAAGAAGADGADGAGVSGDDRRFGIALKVGSRRCSRLKKRSWANEREDRIWKHEAEETKLKKWIWRNEAEETNLKKLQKHKTQTPIWLRDR